MGEQFCVLHSMWTVGGYCASCRGRPLLAVAITQEQLRELATTCIEIEVEGLFNDALMEIRRCREGGAREQDPTLRRCPEHGVDCLDAANPQGCALRELVVEIAARGPSEN